MASFRIGELVHACPRHAENLPRLHCANEVMPPWVVAEYLVQGQQQHLSGGPVLIVRHLLGDDVGELGGGDPEGFGDPCGGCVQLGASFGALHGSRMP